MDDSKGGDMDRERRLTNVEESVHPKKRGTDFVLQVQYVETQIDEQGRRREVPIAAEYDPPTFGAALPSGDRIAVIWPKSAQRTPEGQ
jgi:hypothetical protein